MAVSNASVAVQVAAGKQGAQNCKTLKNRNKKTRREMPTEESASTITHGTFTPPGGASQTLWSRSKQLANCWKNNGFKAKGRIAYSGYKGGIEYKEIKPGDTPKLSDIATPTNVNCDDNGDFSYRANKTKSNSNPDPAHTESRIIEELFAGGTGSLQGTLLMAIDWPTGEPGMEESPCKQCERLICAAMKCGLNIVLCQEGEAKQQDPDKCADDLSGE